MKKLVAILISVCLMLTTVVGCSSTTSTETDTTATTTTTTQTETETTEGDSYHIVATNFSVYDWTKTLLGDDDSVTITYLLDSGVDSHSYQPSADDIIEIAGCDMFIYVGGESDTWVDGVLAQATNDDMIVMNLMEILGDDALAEQTVEGMEVSEDHDHDHDDEETTEEDHDHEDEETTEEDHDHEDEETTEEDHDHEDEEGEADEHIWLSIRNAQTLTTAIADQLAVMNPDSADSYVTNCDNYLAELVDLDLEYASAVDNGTGDTILFGDRFPFLYLVTDYGINYYAAFNGCSAETEASFETIIFLATKMDELGLDTILTIENPQHEIAQTVSNATQSGGHQILVLNSMQSIAADDIAAGASYYTIMTENLAVLIEALG